MFQQVLCAQWEQLPSLISPGSWILFVRDTERGVLEPEFLRGELVHNGLIVESKDDRRDVPGLHQKNHGPRANPWLIVASSSALRRVDRAVPLGNGMRVVHSLNLCDDARW